MNAQKYMEEMKSIQSKLLDFIDNETNEEEHFQNLVELILSLKICKDQDKLKLFLHLLSRISDNHHYDLYFFKKIEQILQYLKEYIKKFFSDIETFNIFVKNKRILLYLIEEKIIILNANIVKKFNTDKYIEEHYPQYFYPEIKPFIDEERIIKYNKSIGCDYGWTEKIIKELNFDENIIFNKNIKSNQKLFFATPEKTISNIESDLSDSDIDNHNESINTTTYDFKEIYLNNNSSSEDDDILQNKQERDSNGSNSPDSKENNTSFNSDVNETMSSKSDSDNENNSFNSDVNETMSIKSDSDNENNSFNSDANEIKSTKSDSDNENNSFNSDANEIKSIKSDSDNENNSFNSELNENDNSQPVIHRCAVSASSSNSENVNENDSLKHVLNESDNNTQEKKENLDSKFYELRKIGQNDNLICKLIREDKIKEFIVYVNKNNVSLTEWINSSIYETNRYLMKNRFISLIKYAVFYGSIQIFKYLQLNNVELEPS